MIELKANENTSIDIISGNFPLGQTDTALVHIFDDVIKEKVKVVGTGACAPEYNLYSYGNFNYPSYINNLQISLNNNCITEIKSGFGVNESNCLHCYSSNPTEGLGIVNIVPDKDITELGITYVLSFWVKTLNFNNSIKLVVKDENDNELASFDLSSYNNWTQVSQDITLYTDKFNLYVDMPSTGEIYIDSVMLFKKSDEINDINYNLNANICIENPKNNVIIDKVINWIYDEANDDLAVLLYVPPITVVDFSNNILCKFNIEQSFLPRYDYLGNVIYYDSANLIYNSAPFVLNGYILDSEKDKIIVDDYLSDTSENPVQNRVIVEELNTYRVAKEKTTLTLFKNKFSIHRYGPVFDSNAFPDFVWGTCIDNKYPNNDILHEGDFITFVLDGTAIEEDAEVHACEVPHLFLEDEYNTTGYYIGNLNYVNAILYSEEVDPSGEPKYALMYLYNTTKHRSELYYLSLRDIDKSRGSEIVNIGLYAGQFNLVSLLGEYIADDSISSAKIKNGSITTEKFADDFIDGSKIKVNSIATDKIIDAAITTSKIADSSVTIDKLASDIGVIKPISFRTQLYGLEPGVYIGNSFSYGSSIALFNSNRVIIVYCDNTRPNPNYFAYTYDIYSTNSKIKIYIAFSLDDVGKTRTVQLEEELTWTKW